MQNMPIFHGFYDWASKTFGIRNSSGEYVRKQHSFSCSRYGEKSIATGYIVLGFRCYEKTF